VAALFPAPNPPPIRLGGAAAVFEVVFCARAGETAMTNNPTTAVKNLGEANAFMIGFRVMIQPAQRKRENGNGGVHWR
jgi:hypothetical protein